MGSDRAPERRLANNNKRKNKMNCGRRVAEMVNGDYPEIPLFAGRNACGGRSTSVRTLLFICGAIWTGRLGQSSSVSKKEERTTECGRDAAMKLN